ncbi:MAG TPA: HD domain-containing protein, partial [Acidimicrobiia bacterium]|nr:HD domain-containing protein [Acidimicrobiia bacterium]
SYEELVERFGERVAGIVRDCSDSEPGAPGAEKENWQKRKKRYLKKLKSHSEDSLLVANADKLHNARAIVADYRIHGEELWARFNPEAETLWYYRSLAKIFRQRRTALSGEFDRVITQLRSLIKKRR